MPYGAVLIAIGVVLALVAYLVTSGLLDTFLYLGAGVLIVVGIIYLISRRDRVV